MSRRELAVVFAAIAVTILVLPLIGAGALWTRPLWLDELVTTFLVSQRSPATMVALIARGGDWNPPLLHLILWPIARAAGGMPPALLRSVAVVFAALALLFTYAILRRRFTVSAAASGVLAVAGHTVVIAQAFEGRFYAPWMLFAAGYAWSLGLVNARRPWMRDVTQAVFAALLCTIHWFGVFSLGLMMAAAYLSLRQSWRESFRLFLPSGVGILALLACVPLAMSQRAGATSVLWVFPLSTRQIADMSRLYWMAPAPILAAILLLRHGPRGDATHVAPGTQLRRALTDPSIAALLALGAMPVVLIVLSVVLQPAMVDRYAMVAALAWGPLVALAVDSLDRLARAAVVAFLVALAWSAAQAIVGEKRAYAERVAANASAFHDAQRYRLPIVFQSLHEMYPVAGPEYPHASLARFLDLPDSSLRALYPSDRLEWLRKRFRLDRDQGRYHAGIYGFPVMATQAELDTTSRFILLATDLALPGGYKQVNKWGAAVFPHHDVVRLNDVLTLFVRKTSQ